MTRVGLVAAFALVACAASGPAPRAPLAAPSSLVALDGAPFALRWSDAPLTVVEFFSAHCPCQEVHDARLRELFARYHPRGVAFVAIDSETDATPARDATQAKTRAYPYPLVLDPGAKVADALGAEYATYTLVVDASGRVVYRGGIDSDKWRLTDDATPLLANAIDDALAGHAPRVAEGKTLGCALRKS